MITSINSTVSIRTGHLVIALAIVVAACAVLLWMGRSPICECGTIKLWHGEVISSENSQHLSDWYTPTHIVHGLLFYALLHLLAKPVQPGGRLVLAVFMESAWEVVENTDAVINRYREATIALDYYGDSVLNSAADIGAMLAGYLFAKVMPVWLSVALVLILEISVALVIRDNLTLNLIMLIHPVEVIKAWQMGGG